MPKGLAFLSKKSFHTSKLCNQEKVWLAEKAKEAEDAKIRELTRQIEQEREEEELLRISGNKSKKLDRGIDWMYQGGQASGSGGTLTAFEEEQKKKEAEDYLLGKEYNPSNMKSGDFAQAASESSVGLNKVIAAAESLPVVTQQFLKKDMTAEQEWNADFHLRYEDPMFMVEQRRKEKERDKEKKKELFGDYHDMNGSKKNHASSSATHDEDNYDEGHKRRSRRDEKSRHISRRKRSYSSDDSYDSRRYSSRKRDRQREGKRDHRYTSRSRSRSRSPSRDRRHRNSHHPRGWSRSSSRDRSYDHKDVKESRCKRNIRDHRRVDNPSRSDRSDKYDNTDGERKQYGLIGATLSRPSDIAPDTSLLTKKRQEKDDARYRNHRSNRNDFGAKRRLTEEEREKALAEMQEHANQRFGEMNQANLKSNNSDLYDEEIQRRVQGHESASQRNFLEETTAKAHAISVSQDATLSSRLSATRHRHLKDDT